MIIINFTHRNFDSNHFKKHKAVKCVLLVVSVLHLHLHFSLFTLFSFVESLILLAQAASQSVSILLFWQSSIIFKLRICFVIIVFAWKTMQMQRGS